MEDGGDLAARKEVIRRALEDPAVALRRWETDRVGVEALRRWERSRGEATASGKKTPNRLEKEKCFGIRWDENVFSTD
jgi:hypothetical protein